MNASKYVQGVPSKYVDDNQLLASLGSVNNTLKVQRSVVYLNQKSSYCYSTLQCWSGAEPVVLSTSQRKLVSSFLSFSLLLCPYKTLEPGSVWQFCLSLRARINPMQMTACFIGWVHAFSGKALYLKQNHTAKEERFHGGNKYLNAKANTCVYADWTLHTLTTAYTHHILSHNSMAEPMHNTLCLGS